MSRKLNIAVFSTASLPIPPFAGYGGTQRGVYDFLVQMNRKGHRLHLFGPGDSNVGGLENVSLHSPVKQSLWVPENTATTEEKEEQSRIHFEQSIRTMRELDQTNDLDIINIRFDNLPALEQIVDEFGRERIVYSLHNIRNKTRIEAIRDLGIQCVAHCRNHREQYEDLSNITTIVYGIDVKSYPFSQATLSQLPRTPALPDLVKLWEQKRDYLITLGGIGKNKGQKTSVMVAKEAGIPLIIAGTPQDRTSN